MKMGITVEILRAVRDGEKSFDDLARETWQDWERVAAFAIRKWGQWGHLDVADVRQEILIGAWRALLGFDPTRSNEKWLAHFVIFGGISHARKRCKKQIEGRDAVATAMPLDIDPRSEQPVDRELDSLRHVLDSCTADGRREVVRMFAEIGSVSAVADRLYDHPDTRLEHEFMSRENARWTVRRHVVLAIRSAKKLERSAA